MKINPEEQAAIRTVIDYGQRFGYGNLIGHLETAWAKWLMNLWDMDEKAARAASGPGYPFAMQADLVERGEWDETGKRYRKAGDA